MYVINTDAPDGPTKHGCKCLPVFWYDGVKYTNKCILDKREQGNEFWCPTEDNCGSYTIAGKLNLNSLYHNDSYSYDECYYYPVEKNDSDFNNTENNQRSTNFLLLNILSYTLFIITYLLFCYFISKKNKELALLLLANIDLVVTSIQYNGGPGNNMFVLMYNEEENNLFSKTSVIITNLIALIGVILTILLKDVSFNRKLLISFITLTVTYFIPNDFIKFIQYKIHDHLYNLVDYKTRAVIKSKSLKLNPDIKRSSFASENDFINAANIQNLKIYGSVDPIFQSEILDISLTDIQKNFKKIKKKYNIDMEDIEHPDSVLMKWVIKNFKRDKLLASDIIHYLNYYYSVETEKTKDKSLKDYFSRFIRNKKESNLIKKHNYIPFKNNVFFYLIIVFVGLLVSVIFILIEHYLIKYIHLSDLDFFIK